ncbi:phospholipase D-like domain-containing protein [Palleronia pelagia]|uniref:Phospholipase D n=1 Tax=Palleronia pelagia TaxID=387096 RepID=A0A1H8ETV4_9RHOB|nr:phospholipase D-like domain-containing protein [Palleronia pelagia]SEN22347.1 phospholipase D1/2 [Palleronia pelagia]
MTDTAAPRLLLTAEEAFPAFEEAVLAAQDRIVMGFRVFDAQTKLRSENAREIGEDWFDLLIHTLRRGVRIDLTLSDFDPIVSPEMHAVCWSSMRQMASISELAGPDAAPLRARAAMHPARVGWLTGFALWPRVARELAELRETLNGLEAPARLTRFRHLRRAHRWLRVGAKHLVEQHSGGPFPLHPVSHHQKLAVMDGRVLYIGGLDLNGRRYDTRQHRGPGEQTWHDVQMIVEGPAAAAAEAHLEAMADVTRGDADPTPGEGGFVRTLSKRRHRPLTAFGPSQLLTEINDTIFEEAAASRDLIYFETQFFRDRALARHLSDLAGQHPDLKLLMVLPAAPEDVAFHRRTKVDARFGEYLQARCVRQVSKAFGDRAYFASPAQPRSELPGPPPGRDVIDGAPLIYVHAKLCVFDDRSTLVSSANLNGRSLHWDTEAGVLTKDGDFARNVLSRALTHWAGQRAFDPQRSAIEQVRGWAEEDRFRQPENRESFLLPYDVRPARKFGMPLPGVPGEIV